MTPGEPPQVTRETLPHPEPVRDPEYHWYHKMYAVLFVTFCLEVGIFLIVFPWTDYWESNYFATILSMSWHRYWDNTYMRGAVSGLGVVNLYIAVVEAFRLRRFARPDHHREG